MVCFRGLAIGSVRMQPQLTYTADPAAFMEGAAHAAYFTDATKVMRERLKRRNKSAREAYRKSIFCRLEL